MRFLLFLTLAAASCAGSARIPEAATGRVVEAENRRFQAMIRRDTAALRPMLAGNLVYIHSNGLLESRTAHLDAIGQRRISYNIMTREDAPAVRWLDRRTALVNGVLRVHGLIGEEPFAVKLRYTAVYRDGRGKAGGLELVSWQSTRLPE